MLILLNATQNPLDLFGGAGRSKRMPNFMLSKAKTEVIPEHRRGFLTNYSTKFVACSPLMTCRTSLFNFLNTFALPQRS